MSLCRTQSSVTISGWKRWCIGSLCDFPISSWSDARLKKRSRQLLFGEEKFATKSCCVMLVRCYPNLVCSTIMVHDRMTCWRTANLYSSTWPKSDIISLSLISPSSTAKIEQYRHRARKTSRFFHTIPGAAFEKWVLLGDCLRTRYSALFPRTWDFGVVGMSAYSIHQCAPEPFFFLKENRQSFGKLTKRLLRSLILQSGVWNMRQGEATSVRKLWPIRWPSLSPGRRCLDDFCGGRVGG